MYIDEMRKQHAGHDEGSDDQLQLAVQRQHRPLRLALDRQPGIDPRLCSPLHHHGSGKASFRELHRRFPSARAAVAKQVDGRMGFRFARGEDCAAVEAVELMKARPGNMR